MTRYAFYATRDRTTRQRDSDLECLANEVRHGAKAVAIAVARADGIVEWTWSGEPSVGLAVSLEAMAKDVRAAIGEDDA